MLRFLLNAFCFFELIHTIYGEEPSCSSTNDVKYSCKRRIIIALDDTSDIAGKRGQEFSIANSVMRRLDIREDVISIALTTYGTKSPMTYGFDNDRNQICSDFGNLWKGSDSAVEAKPWRKLRNLFNRIISTIDISDALLVLFTKDNEQKDVDAAGELLQDHITKGTANNFSVLVIDMGDSSFNSWPEITVMRMISTNDTEPTAEYVSLFVCGSPTTTTTTQSTARTTKPTPSSSTTTSSLNTTNFGTTTAFPPTPTPVEKFSSGCECVPKTIWLDVFLLMEAGVSMTSNGIASATDYIVSAFGKLTVGQADQFQTRLGVIRYASSVDLIADLDVYTSKVQLFDLEIQPLNETGTNIDGAIRLARARFSSPTHRRAARKVIIIVGSSYTRTVYEDPTRVANEFRSEGGIIITIEYLQGTETSTPMFKQLASPNYSLINFENGKQLRAQELRQLLCKANCFCKRNWIPYSKDKWSTPQGGCYLPVTISSTQILARRTCHRKNDGILAVDEDLKKDAFLTKLVPPKTNFWLGLEWKGNDWMWPDGFSVGRFTKWAKGHPISGRGDCVYMQKNANNKTAWFADDCENDYFHICQTKPCDSTKYCPFQLSNDESEI